MNIPGFTAEASLYRSERKSEHYLMAGAHTHADGAIQPAWLQNRCWLNSFGQLCCRDFLSGNISCSSVPP
jgi:hypothetical protein